VLNGLPAAYQPVISALEATCTEPRLDDLVRVLQPQEQRLLHDSSSDEPSMVLAFRGQPARVKQKPAGSRPTGAAKPTGEHVRGTDGRSQPVDCYVCGARGHFQSKCPKQRGKGEQAAAAPAFSLLATSPSFSF